MKRVVGILVAPLQLISRPVALLAVALLLVGAWGLTAFIQTAQVARDTLNSLGVAAGAAASSIDVPLEHFANMSDSIRAGDLQGDKIALTSRLLRLQAAVPPAATTFAVNASGQLLASSSPFAATDASVGDSDWFRRATADNGMVLSLQRSDSWLRSGTSLLLTRMVRDVAGKPAGLVGALFRFDDVARMIGHTWLGPGVTLELRGVDGPLVLSNQTATGQPPTAASGPTWDWGNQLLAIANPVLGIPVRLSISAPLRSVDATVNAGIATDVALRTHWLGTRPVAIIGGYLLAVWFSCMALAVSVRSKDERQSPAPIGFGADWQAELDRRGCIKAIHGFAPDRLRDAIGQPLLAALGLVPSQEAGSRVAEALDARSRQDNIQVTLSGEGGADRVHRLRIEPLPDGSYICAGRDVTTEVELTAKLQLVTTTCAAAQEQAETVARDRDRVLAALGHDVRTPMNSIMGICSLLLDSELEQEQRLWLERIRASCDALLAMLNGLLEIASGEVGSAELQTDEVDVIGLVREVTETLQPQARDKGLELKTRYDDLLRGQWLVDPARLRQVLFNLIGNAIKFTHNGHIEVRASTVAGSSKTPSIKIAISDTGPGIAPEDRDLIFERFRRGHDQENGVHPGLGLGLALCRENATLMGGTLAVESALGVGSEFTFEFPAARIAQSLTNQPFSGRTALLVGDDDARARSVAGLLSDSGIVTEMATDGYLGLALAERIEAQRGALDLIIVQGRLLGMATEVFVHRLRDTAYGRRALIICQGDEATQANVDAVLAAAADPYEVASAVQQLLGQRSPLEVLEPLAAVARGGRILIVEDDKVNQSLLVAGLSRRGFSTFVANDGDEAVRLASHDSFDAILMDIQMPHRDGFEATQKIRTMSGRAATIPIIALTGLKGAAIHKRCLESGFTAVLEKPINLDRLGATLRRWLSGSSSARIFGVGLPQPGADRLDSYEADVSLMFLEEMVAVVGVERARACIADFAADAIARCMRLFELLPGWEAGAIVRNCEEISGLAETCGAIGLGEVLEEIADAVTRDDRSRAEALVERLEAVTARLEPAMMACLDHIASRWPTGNSKAA